MISGIYFEMMFEHTRNFWVSVNQRWRIVSKPGATLFYVFKQCAGNQRKCLSKSYTTSRGSTVTKMIHSMHRL